MKALVARQLKLLSVVGSQIQINNFSTHQIHVTNTRGQNHCTFLCVMFTITGAEDIDSSRIMSAFGRGTSIEIVKKNLLPSQRLIGLIIISAILH